MASGTVVFIPPNGGNIIQAGQGIPGTVIQPTQMVQYVQYGGQHRGQAMAKFLKVEAKTLGAIQIVIGLVHICFASVSLLLCGQYYSCFTAISGYPFWGSIFFIISGSLSVSAEKRLTPGLVKCSVGMNITSAVMAFTGMVLYTTELALRSYSYYPQSIQDYYLANSVGTGLAVLLLLFSLLEFCITVSVAHFGCQAACCISDQEVVFVPYAVSGGNVVPTEGSLAPPPAYDTVDSSHK